MQQQKNIIVGISGASGSLLSVKLLEILQKIDHIKTHLVISKSALITCNLEVDKKYSEIKKLADFSYNINDISAAISSGSFLTDGMIIIPCSVKTLAEIASGHSTSLLTRKKKIITNFERNTIYIDSY